MSDATLFFLSLTVLKLLVGLHLYGIPDLFYSQPEYETDEGQHVDILCGFSAAPFQELSVLVSLHHKSSAMQALRSTHHPTLLLIQLFVYVF